MTASTPVVAASVVELRAAIDAAKSAAAKSAEATRAARPSIGFVPTMGYLHEGHAALLRRARAESDVVVASVFVNPTQFGAGEDFTTYPRDVPRDLALLAREAVDVAFVPPPRGFYPPGAATSVVVGAVAEPLEGAARPGHFRGVATVVTMLFNAVSPARAYFGDKDWQQLQVIKRLVRDLHLPVSIVGVPTVREGDGLALSSRNVRLSAADRAKATILFRALAAARRAYAAGERSPAKLERALATELAKEPDAVIEYAVVVDGASLQPIVEANAGSRALIAARVGGVRLIDNGALTD